MPIAPVDLGEAACLVTSLESMPPDRAAIAAAVASITGPGWATSREREAAQVLVARLAILTHRRPPAA